MQSARYTIVAILLTTAVGSPLIAADTAPSRPKELPSVLADCRITVFARQALQENPALALLNVGVSVQDNIATLWGPIPSADLARHAEQTVRRVPGVAAVRNELQVEVTSASIQNMFGPPIKLTPREPVLMAVAPFAGTLAKRPFENKPAPPVPSTPPIVISLRPPLPADLPVPVVAATAQAPSDLETSVNDVRSAEARFRHVRAEIKDRIVHLRGTVPRGEDMYDLAQRVAKVPGVKRVVVEEVQTPPKRRPLALP
jgi:osmotically-inducible protein OsmY